MYGSLFELTLGADDAQGNLRFLRVSQDGAFVGGSSDVQVEFDGTVAPLNRDALLIGDDTRDFSKTVQVRVPEVNDSTTYAFIVSDTCGLSDTATLTPGDERGRYPASYNTARSDVLQSVRS